MSVRYQLVMRTGPNPGATYALEASQTTIGRDGSNSISINDAEISRHHARMTMQGGKIVLEDLGSTNGTSVNGNRIAGPHVLKPGEMVGFGEDIVFVFEVESFDPDATVLSSAAHPYSQPQPAAAPRQQPVAPPMQPPPQAYAGQVPADPIPMTPPPASASPGGRKALPIVLAVSALVLLCSCGLFFWWVDATYRWCTFFPFISGC
jgi:predicted component of type VI protein secretion system